MLWKINRSAQQPKRLEEMTMTIKLKGISRVAGAVLLLASFSIGVMAQGEKPRPSLTGKYQGTAKSGTDVLNITLELVDDHGTFTGSVTTQFGNFKIVKGKLADDVLTLETEGNGTTGEFTLKAKEDKLVGELKSKGGAGAVELRKVAPDEISGEWDAIADAQGQPFPFSLVLKLDGDKVTGSSSSQLGTSNISSGNWKDGKLAVVLNGDNGQIALVATMIDGKLSGDYDYAGQLQGKWVAVRKK
jgi:hypothetical protein